MTSKWVNNIIAEGYRIPFTHPPPIHLPPTHDPVTSQEESSAITMEINSLLWKNAIEECEGKGFYSHLFTITKKMGGLCPILNLQPLNQFLMAP